MIRVLPAATLLAFTVSVLALARTSPPAQPFQQIDGCIYKGQRWNGGGDSFNVILPDQKELIFRLCFVDVPEEERVYSERIRGTGRILWHQQRRLAARSWYNPALAFSKSPS